MIAVFLRDLEQVFGWLLTASWQASELALLVLLLQWVLRARLNPRWRYALWLLVLVRLLLPALPESALSLFQFAPPPPAAFAHSVSEPLFIATPLPSPEPVIVTIEPAYPFSTYTLLSLIWLTGALALLLLTWQVNRRFARQVANSPDITDPGLLDLFTSAKAELGIRRSIRLIGNGQVQSPAIMGLFHPTLLLPADVRAKFDATELRLIFLHEFAHLKRGDVIVQGLIALLQILHWFNPVLWYTFRRMRIDREPATDALVLSRAGETEKERYGLMLIKLLEHFNQRHSLPTLVGILEDKDQFKRRFSLIARFTRGAYGWSMLAVLLIGVLAAACLTRSKENLPINDQLLEAIQGNDAGRVRKLIDEGADPKKINSPRGSLLLETWSPEVLEILINHGIDPNARPSTGYTPLWDLCTGTGNPVETAQLVRVLLKHGADLNVRVNKFGNTPLMVAHSGPVIDVLLEYGADLKATNNQGADVLHALGNRNLSRFESLVMRHGFPFDIRKEGSDVFVTACNQGNIQVMKWLLDHGVDPNVPGQWQEGPAGPIAPLYAAGWGNPKTNIDVGTLLLAHGARSDAAVGLALLRQDDALLKLFREQVPPGISGLCYQISQGASLADITKLLDQGSPVDPPEDKVVTPLGEAALLGNLDAVKLLVARHADLNAGGVENPLVPELTRTTPLYLAAYQRPGIPNKDGIVEYLLNQGATPEPCAFVEAVRGTDRAHIVRLFLDAGATKSVPPEMAGRILGSAVWATNPAVLKMLLDAGFRPDLPMPSPWPSHANAGTVLSYFQHYYNQYQDDPAQREMHEAQARIKPMLDMLEAAAKAAQPKADTSASSSTTTSSAADQRFNDAINNLRIENLKVQAMPLDQFVQMIHQKLVDLDPEKKGVNFVLSIPPGEAPIPVSLDFTKIPGYRANITMILGPLKARYPIRYKINDAPDSEAIYIKQLPRDEIAFDKKALATLIDIDFSGTDPVSALKTVQATSAARGFVFDLDLKMIGELDAIKKLPTIDLKASDVSVDQALRSIFYLADLHPMPLDHFTGYMIQPQAPEATRALTYFDIGVQPVCFDVGTDNEKQVFEDLRKMSPWWGPSIHGPAYHSDGTPTGSMSFTQKSPSTDGDLEQNVAVDAKIIDKVHLNVTTSLEIKDSHGQTLGKTSGTAILASGARTILAAAGSAAISLPGKESKPPLGFVNVLQSTLVNEEGQPLLPAPSPSVVEIPASSTDMVPAPKTTESVGPPAATETAPVTTTPDPGAPGNTPAAMVCIALKVIQIGDDDYQAHRSEIDAAVEKGNFKPLSYLKSYNLLDESSGLLESGQRAVIEKVRVVPYPIAFEKGADGIFKPTDFKRRDIGVRLPLSAVFSERKINLTGELEVTTLQAWIPAGDTTFQPVFQTRRIPLVSVALDSGQTIGLPASNLQADSSDPDAYFGPNDAAHQPKRSANQCRLFLFLNADTKPPMLQVAPENPGYTGDAIEAAFYQALERDRTMVVDPSVNSSTLAADAQMLLAIQKGDVSTLKQILEHAVNPDTFDPDRFNSCPVYWAVHFNQPKILKLLLEHFATGDLGPAHETPLQLAQRSHPDLVPIIEEGTKRNRALLTARLTEKLHSIHIDLPAFSNAPLTKVTQSLLDATSQAGYLQRRVTIGNMDLPPSTPITSPARSNIPIWDALQTIADANKLRFDVDGSWPGNITLYPPRDEAAIHPPTGKAEDPAQLTNEAHPGTAPKADDPPAATVQEVDLSGKVHFTRPELVDLEQSVGYLVSVDGGSYEIYFQPDGSFALPHVKPGLYNRHIKVVRTEPNPSTLPAEAVDMPLSPLIIDGTSGNMTMNLNLDVPFKDVLKGSIEVGLKVVEISDDVYQAHQSAIDAGVEKGDAAVFALFNNLKGVSLLSAPSVITKPGLKATIEIVREFPYPTSFEYPKTGQIPTGPGCGTNLIVTIPTTPREFVTKDVGVNAEITPSLDNEKIVLNGKFSLVEFAGFTQSNLGPQMPTFDTKETHFLEAVDDNQEKGIWIPGVHIDEPTAPVQLIDGKPLPSVQPGKKRYLFFLSASLVK